MVEAGEERSEGGRERETDQEGSTNVFSRRKEIKISTTGDDEKDKKRLKSQRGPGKKRNPEQ